MAVDGVEQVLLLIWCVVGRILFVDDVAMPGWCDVGSLGVNGRFSCVFGFRLVVLVAVIEGFSQCAFDFRVWSCEIRMTIWKEGLGFMITGLGMHEHGVD